jgi:hypothetical protein
MAALPNYVDVLVDGWGEEPDPSVERSEMERGPAAEAIINSRVQVELQATLAFRSKADALAFETWYYDTIKRVGWFDVVHPVSGVVTSMHFKAGNIGRLVARSRAFNTFQRNVVLEYMRG